MRDQEKLEERLKKQGQTIKSDPYNQERGRFMNEEG
jgi:hypothetical protein